MPLLTTALLCTPPALAIGGAAAAIRARNLDRWLLPYLTQQIRRSPRRPGQPVHVLLTIADHFEPHNGGATAESARARVTEWGCRYPKLFGGFRDSDGRPPRHSFFYPLEQYDREEMDGLTELCRAGFGEVEVHLHHDNDTSNALRGRLRDYCEMLASRHDLLARHRRTGDLAYGFIHGNWALANCRADGRYCGVDDELDVLKETGCYADFTYPSAPERSQPRSINRIYYAACGTGRKCSHESGVEAGTAPGPANSLLMIPGPLTLDWRRRKWGLIPRIENACIQSKQPPTMDRLKLWMRAGVRIAKRPDWLFVKLHTHGAPERNQAVLLGDAMVRFHQSLAEHADQHPEFCYHYVTARELYNLARAAEAGFQGSVAEARDFELLWNGSTSGNGIASGTQPTERAASLSLSS